MAYKIIAPPYYRRMLKCSDMTGGVLYADQITGDTADVTATAVFSSENLGVKKTKWAYRAHGQTHTVWVLEPETTNPPGAARDFTIDIVNRPDEVSPLPVKTAAYQATAPIAVGPRLLKINADKTKYSISDGYVFTDENPALLVAFISQYTQSLLYAYTEAASSKNFDLTFTAKNSVSSQGSWTERGGTLLFAGWSVSGSARFTQGTQEHLSVKVGVAASATCEDGTLTLNPYTFAPGSPIPFSLAGYKMTGRIGFRLKIQKTPLGDWEDVTIRTHEEYARLSSWFSFFAIYGEDQGAPEELLYVGSSGVVFQPSYSANRWEAERFFANVRSVRFNVELKPGCLLYGWDLAETGEVSPGTEGVTQVRPPPDKNITLYVQDFSASTYYIAHPITGLGETTSGEYFIDGELRTPPYWRSVQGGAPPIALDCIVKRWAEGGAQYLNPAERLEWAFGSGTWQQAKDGGEMSLWPFGVQTLAVGAIYPFNFREAVVTQKLTLTVIVHSGGVSGVSVVAVQGNFSQTASASGGTLEFFQRNEERFNLFVKANVTAGGKMSTIAATKGDTEPTEVPGVIVFKGAQNVAEVLVTVGDEMFLGNLSGISVKTIRSSGTETTLGHVEWPETVCSSAVGTIAVVDYQLGQSVADPIKVIITSVNGYTPVRVVVYDNAPTPHELGQASAKKDHASQQISVTLSFADFQDRGDINVVLFVQPDETSSSLTVRGKAVVDSDMFTATIRNKTVDDGTWRVGDEAEVSLSPIKFAGVAMPDVCIHSVWFNGVLLPDFGVSPKVNVVLTRNINVVDVRCGVAVNARTVMADGSPVAGAAAPVLTSPGSEPREIEDVKYYETLMGCYATLENLNADVARFTNIDLFERSLSGEFVFKQVKSVDAPSSPPAVFLCEPRYPSRVDFVYYYGEANPWIFMSVYSYKEKRYLVPGDQRPYIEVEASAPHVLSENDITEKPAYEDITGQNPGEAFYNSVFVAQQVVSDAGIAAITINVGEFPSSVRLEKWTGEFWVTQATKTSKLPVTAFFRVAVGSPPDELIALTVEAIRTVSGGDISTVGRVRVTGHDGSPVDLVGTPTFSVRLVKAMSVILNAQLPRGWSVIRWEDSEGAFLGDKNFLMLAPQSDVAVVLVAQVSPHGLTSRVKTLGGSQTERQTGMWVSKEFAAPMPWFPLVANAVMDEWREGCLLTVSNGRSPSTDEDFFIHDDERSTIAIVNQDMRRFPRPARQMDRFHRVGVRLQGSARLLSVAAASSSATLGDAH